MTDDGLIEQAAASAFKALQAKARTHYGGNTGPLLTVYAVESFLRRLALSPYAHKMVLKGGMLMAANSIRAMTRDADLSTLGVDNDDENVKRVVTAIAVLEPTPHDGIIIDVDSIRTETMREDAESQGVRCKLVARLGKAKVPFALDFSFGDPGRSTVIELASVIDQPPVLLDAYPLALNLAEKIVTAMQRRETNTRDRDFADLWVASRLHSLTASDLRQHVVDVAGHRGQPIIPIAEALVAMPTASSPTGRWSSGCPTSTRRRSNSRTSSQASSSSSTRCSTTPTGSLPVGVTTSFAGSSGLAAAPPPEPAPPQPFAELARRPERADPKPPGPAQSNGISPNKGTSA